MKDATQTDYSDHAEIEVIYIEIVHNVNVSDRVRLDDAMKHLNGLGTARVVRRRPIAETFSKAVEILELRAEGVKQ